MLVTMTVKVLRLDLPRATYDEIAARAQGGSLGEVVCDALRATLPALIAMSESPLAKGSRPQIAVSTEQPAGLAALRRIAEHTPPPARFTHPIQLAIPTELWLEVERERTRLGLSVDELVAWAWRRR